MKYDIRIVGADADNGRIEFDRLNRLTKSTKAIATKALMMELHGFSDIQPSKFLKKALDLYLESIKGDAERGTSLTISASSFANTIQDVQYDLFKPKDELLLTPMALVISAFRHALDYSGVEQTGLDKPLLTSLLAFQNNFISENEVFYLSNRGTIPEITLTKADFSKIKQLENSIPEPRKTTIEGKLDEMKISANKLGLQTEQGTVTLFAQQESLIAAILPYMGKDITISGMAHFRPNGKLSFVEMQNFDESAENGLSFSKKPSAFSAQQQLLFRVRRSEKDHSLQALKEMSGLLQDEISDLQFAEMKEDIHR